MLVEAYIKGVCMLYSLILCKEWSMRVNGLTVPSLGILRELRWLSAISPSSLFQQHVVPVFLVQSFVSC